MMAGEAATLLWTATRQRRFGLPQTARRLPPPDAPTGPDEPIQSGATTPQSTSALRSITKFVIGPGYAFIPFVSNASRSSSFSSASHVTRCPEYAAFLPRMVTRLLWTLGTTVGFEKSPPVIAL